MPSLTPRELARKQRQVSHPPRSARPSPPLPESARPMLGDGMAQSPTDLEVTAARAWAAHVAGGRIGLATPASPVPSPAGEYCLASLAKILGRA